MRKISAHYCLLPDGTLGKMPVIAIDDNNVITDVLIMGNDFKEEHGVELFSGIIIPGFIEDFRGVTATSAQTKEINRLYVQGSLKYISYSNHIVFPAGFKGKVYYEVRKERNADNIDTLQKTSAWEKIKIQSVQTNISILDLIHNYFSDMRNIIPNKLMWGMIEQGANPGLLLIKGLDYKGMKTGKNTTIKILVS